MAGGTGKPFSYEQVQHNVNQLWQQLPEGEATAYVEAVAQEWKKSKGQANKPSEHDGPPQQANNTDTPFTSNGLRKLHQKFERHEEQADRAHQAV
jgi:hypothetical protein